MSKIKQNLVVLIEPSEGPHESSMRAENMILNRFCIDEDTAFELSGVNDLNLMFNAKRKVKGKEYSLCSYFI